MDLRTAQDEDGRLGLSREARWKATFGSKTMLVQSWHPQVEREKTDPFLA
jgi:hypothetical protein